MSREAKETGETLDQLLQGLTAAFAKVGITVEWRPYQYDQYRGHLSGKGITQIEIKAQWERSRDRYDVNEISGYNVYVGWRNRQRFPPRKAGHDYDAIVSWAIADHDREQKIQRSQEARQRSREELKGQRLALIGDLGIADRGLAGDLSINDDDKSFDIHLRRLTLEQARAILTAAKDVLS